MKAIFIVFSTIYLGFITEAKSEVKLNCTVQGPCNWLDPIPGVTEDHLGYCIDKIEGNDQHLLMTRKDGDGNFLSSVELIVEVVSKDELKASDSENLITLSASKYENFLAGGLIVRTKSIPSGLGFYLSCEFQENDISNIFYF